MDIILVQAALRGSLLFLFSSIFIIDVLHGDYLYTTANVYHASVDKGAGSLSNNDNMLTCYNCNTTVDGQLCSNHSLLREIDTFHKKCKPQNACMVKTYSYTTFMGNSTSEMKLWALSRECTDKCDDGCLIIGERTKLYICSTCCFSSFCNAVNIASTIFDFRFIVVLPVFLQMYLFFNT